MSDLRYNSMIERKGKDKLYPHVIAAITRLVTPPDRRLEEDILVEQVEEEHQSPELASTTPTEELVQVTMTDSTQMKM